MNVNHLLLCQFFDYLNSILHFEIFDWNEKVCLKSCQNDLYRLSNKDNTFLQLQNNYLFNNKHLRLLVELIQMLSSSCSNRHVIWDQYLTATLQLLLKLLNYTLKGIKIQKRCSENCDKYFSNFRVKGINNYFPVIIQELI